MMNYCLLTLTFFLVVGQALPTAAAVLQKISKSEDRASAQVFFAFDQLPRHTSTVSGKRFTIVFENTVFGEGLPVFEADDKIIKILVEPEDNNTVISLYFRYDPQRTTITPAENQTLVADILLGNQYSGTYRDFSAQLQGVTVLDRQTEDFANPLVASPYAKDWQTFFAEYESPVTIEAPVAFLLPEFPIIRLIPPGLAGNAALIPEPALVAALDQSWNKVVATIQEALRRTPDIESQKLLALAYGEALMRLDNYDGAYKQFYLLKKEYPKEQVGLFASYLLGILQANNGDPYSADFEFQNLTESIKPGHPLAPYLQLNLAETSLATGQIDKLDRVLARDDLAYPPRLLFRRELRQADLLRARNQPVQAYVAYRLASRNTDLNNHPYSLNGWCATLYEQRDFQGSDQCYARLTELIEDRAQLGMAYYRSAMSQLKFSTDRESLINEFSRIEDAFPDTEAGFRAALKKTDLRYLSRRDWSTSALRYYQALAARSTYRPVSEEAYFKEALLYHRVGNDPKAIELTMTLLRNFRSGPVRPSAEALLIQLLPGELRRLVEAGDYAAALVLARQNRKLFENNWIDVSILAELAYSNRQLGLYDNALRLYHYLMQISAIDQKERYYLPLVEISYLSGNFNLVEDYATQYDYYFPNGASADDILYLRLSALFRDGNPERALELLPKPLPGQARFRYLAAALQYHQDNFQAVVDILTPDRDQPTTLPDETSFFLAESLYRTARLQAAEPFFEQLRDNRLYQSQAIFRLAEIARQQGDERLALNLFSEIASSSDDSLWKEFAEQELELRNLTNSL